MRSRDLKRKDIRFSPLLLDLLMSCESHCVAECCGVAAFDFAEVDFRSWLHRHSAEEGRKAAEDLEGVIRRIQEQTEELVRSKDLNHEWAKAKAVEFFSGLHRTLKGVA